MSKIIAKIAVICLLLITKTAHAENFYIDNYDVDLTVYEDNSVLVSEVIEVVFTNPSHGIIRSIPLQGSRIYDVEVNAPFILSKNMSELDIRIGSADKLVEGVQIYNIRYLQKIYNKKPEFYYNIIGTEWDNPINNVRFRVKMPKPFDANKAGISIGSYGIRGFDSGAEYQVNDREILGITHRPLSPHQCITVRVEVPEDYFFNVQSKWVNVIWLGLMLCTLFSFLLWYQYGKDEHVTPVVTFNIPDDISCTDVELIMSEKVTDKGLIAMIVKLANDGYLKIKNVGKNFTLYDFKKYQGYNVIERKLLKALNNQKLNREVSGDTLKSSSLFYQEWQEILKQAGKDEVKEHFYETYPMSFSMRCLMGAFIFINIVMTVFCACGYRITVEHLFISSVTIFVLAAMISTLRSNAALGQKLYAVLLLLSFGIPLYDAFSELINLQNTSQVMFGVFGTLISIICYNEMMKPNINGRLMKGKLLGLKKFIEVAEKDRLEKMAADNPQYFYKILPYAYVLGVSKVWIKQFEGIAVPPPEWADSGIYRMNSFEGFTRNFSNAVAPSVNNGGISNSSYSSSSGGGGFSGGGFGGGGGRSW